MCLFLAALASRQATAQETGQEGATSAREVVLLRASPGLEAEGRAIAERLVERRAAAGHDAALPPSPAIDDGRDPVTESTSRAEDAYAALHFGEATETIGATVASLETTTHYARRELVELFLLAARVRLAADDPDAARAAVREALAIDPTLVVDPARHPPTLVALAEGERANVTSCVLSVSTDPDDATLRVDGADVDARPSTLPCGDHWITARRDGYTAVTRRVSLTPEASAALSFSLSLDPAAALSRTGAPGEPLPALAERGAAALGRAPLVLDVTRDADGALVVSLRALGRVVRRREPTSPDTFASLLLAPADTGADVTAIAVGASVGGAVLIAVVVALGVVLSPSAPSGFVPHGEIVP